MSRVTPAVLAYAATATPQHFLPPTPAFFFNIRVAYATLLFSLFTLGVTRSVLRGTGGRQMVPPMARSEYLESPGGRPQLPELSLRVRAGATVEGVNVLAGTVVDLSAPECELS